MNKKIKYLCFLVVSVFNASLCLSQPIENSVFYEDITDLCKMSKFPNKHFLIEIENHEHVLKGPKSDVYSIIKANKDERFLNVYCYHEEFNNLLILTSRKKEDKWVQYAAYQILIPNVKSTSILVNTEFPDIHTAYLLYENENKELESYVIRLVENGYASYKFLNNPYTIDDFRPSRRKNGRPKF